MEEQVTAFGLGVLVVLTVVGVINMFKSARKLNIMRGELNGLLLDSVDLQNENSRKFEELNERIHTENEKLYKYVDSRTDKMESRCDNKFNANDSLVDKLYDTIEEVKQKIKSKLK